MNSSERVLVKRFDAWAWFIAARPKTLYAGIAPVMVGAALAYQGYFQVMPTVLCLLFSLLVQIGCNYANDYYDYINGVDTEERVGFKRMVSSGRIAPKAMKIGTFVVLLMAFLIGCGLLPYGGYLLLIVGGVSILCAVAYTGGPFPLGYYGLGDIFVFIFYGLVAVLFTFYVLAGYFSMAAFWVGVGCGCLAANIRLVNDIRDKDTDAKAGKKTSAVRFGYRFCYAQYIISVCVACGVVPVVLWKKLGFSAWILLPLCLVVFFVRMIKELVKASNGAAYNKLLVQSAKMFFFYAIFLSVGVILI